MTFFFLDKTDIGSSDHYLVWFELGSNFGTSRKKARNILFKLRIDGLKDEKIKNEYQVEVGVHASEFFESL